MQELKTTINELPYRIKYRVDLCGSLTIWNIYGLIGAKEIEMDLYAHVVNLLTPEAWSKLETECKEAYQELERELEYELQ